MAPPRKRDPMAGGFLLAAAIIIGVIGGGLLGQPSIGFLAGTGVGLLLLGLVWYLDRSR
ncbi:MAG TPA: hypothetical protein VNT25_05075 [Allosphingosinicella sp.]|nr:hypothetical protein [Allosphingosinicella sp.]